jgi:hypothetical protein
MRQYAIYPITLAFGNSPEPASTVENALASGANQAQLNALLFCHGGTMQPPENRAAISQRQWLR